MRKTAEKKMVLIIVVFLIYIFMVLNLTVIRLNFRYDERQLNLSLLIDLINVYKTIGVGEFLRLLLGNIGWFVPFGFLFPFLLKKERLSIVIIMGFVFSFIIETLQYILRKGVAELDDLILNVLGTAIGYFLFKLSQRIILKLKT